MNLPYISFIVAAALALGLVPMLARFARQIGLVDVPDNSRKLHTSAIPMVGGLATFLAVVCTAALGYQFYREQLRLRPDDSLELSGLLIGSFILLLVGLVDDLWNLRGRQKLIGQIIAITALILTGYQFDHFQCLGLRIEFGIFAVLVIYAWMLVAINSVNLLDGADGFASTIGIVMSLALGVMAIYQGKIVDAAISLGLAGALVGFLRYNFPPAKAYLGDSGSMLIGFVLGAMAIRCSFKQATAYALFAPIALLAIPLIDTGAAIVRRRMTGRSIYTVDRGHLHHRLMKQGYGPRVSLVWVALLCTMTAAGAVLTVVYQQSEYAIVSIAIVMCVLLFARIFGLAEFQLVSNKALSIGRSMLGSSPGKATHVQSTVHVQGNRDWQEIWNQVCQFADEHQLNEVTMDLNVPWMHESFHATRRRAGSKKDSSREWYIQLPLVVGNRLFGRIEVLGDKDGKFSHYDVVNDMLKISADIEQSLGEAAADPAIISPEEVAVTVDS
jgi:UDP-GlcNAc:undecaprenyl-phosphate GlcNAc-1-phosphate transferase